MLRGEPPRISMQGAYIQGMCDRGLLKVGYVVHAAGIWYYMCMWRVYTEHWKQLLKEFGAACVCGAVYTQHW